MSGEGIEQNVNTNMDIKPKEKRKHESNGIDCIWKSKKLNTHQELCGQKCFESFKLNMKNGYREQVNKLVSRRDALNFEVALRLLGSKERQSIRVARREKGKGKEKA